MGKHVGMYQGLNGTVRTREQFCRVRLERVNQQIADIEAAFREIPKAGATDVQFRQLKHLQQSRRNKLVTRKRYMRELGLLP